MAYKLVSTEYRNRNRKLSISRTPTKRSRGNQLILRRLTRTKSIGSGQNPENQAGTQSDGYGGWCLELRWGGRYGEEDEPEFIIRIHGLKARRCPMQI